MSSVRAHLACLLGWAIIASPSAILAEPGGPDLIKPDKTVVFLGDSITAGGTYIAYIDMYLRSHFPENTYRLINLGLSSETASGDSEKDHPFPRPCVHERIDRILSKAKPDITFVCYGMNDGIYYPLSDARFERYRDGINRLVKKISDANSEVVLITPPPFDPESRRLRGRPLQNAEAVEFGFKGPYEDYDNVLMDYGNWIMGRKEGVALTVDVHTPMLKDITRRRGADSDYQSGDGVHPNSHGHYAMALALLDALNAPGIDDLPNYSELGSEDPLFAPLQIILQRQKLLGASWREHVGHNRPTKGKDSIPSLADAKAQAAELDIQIQELLDKP